MSAPVVYLDNAATTWPKPEPVYAAMDAAMREHGGNPGRASHRLSVAAQKLVEDARQDVRRVFNAPSAERVVFTLNCTDALCLALKGLIKPGDRVVTGPFEHNSVARPLHSLRRAGAAVTQCQATSGASIDLDHFRDLCRQGVDYVVMSHVSNVTGCMTPVGEIAAIAHERGASFILDAAQSAGSVEIDMVRLGIDALAAPGHKGLCGPMGTGVLVLSANLPVAPFREGGSGIDSASEEHPQRYPWRLEGGTLNVPGIAGLGAGVRFIECAGIRAVGEREAALARALVGGLTPIDGVRIFGSAARPETGVVSFRIDGVDVALTGAILDESYGIAVRTGLHCAPAAHRAIGSFPEGTVRVSLGPFNSEADVAALVSAVRDIAAGFGTRCASGSNARAASRQ
ncbi:MAG TPA: aminotransferase class V-fold PLP-dependent enzyme [Burkholderiales bacterium]|nr:aminotransferase class V-fold PLP-dependent enzyme [Burkholderiales bacterium]